MKIYNYDPITKEYKGVGLATIDPIASEISKKNVWVYPINATDKQPPKVKENEVVIYDGKRWKVKSDFRGVKYWTKTGVEKVITEIGKTIPKSAVIIEPKVVITENYGTRRRQAYGSIEDQLDALYWDMVNGSNRWVNHITKVKKKYKKR